VEKSREFGEFREFREFLRERKFENTFWRRLVWA